MLLWNDDKARCPRTAARLFASGLLTCSDAGREVRTPRTLSASRFNLTISRAMRLFYTLFASGVSRAGHDCHRSNGAEHLGSSVLPVQANSSPHSRFALPAPMGVPTSVKRARLPLFFYCFMVHFPVRIMTAQVLTRTLKRESCVGAAKKSMPAGVFHSACFAICSKAVDRECRGTDDSSKDNS